MLDVGTYEIRSQGPLQTHSIAIHGVALCVSLLCYFLVRKLLPPAEYLHPATACYHTAEVKKKKKYPDLLLCTSQGRARSWYVRDQGPGSSKEKKNEYPAEYK